ncbi:MAG TPA: twin-arginine translocase subunit TatB [Alphaproteobacteria bacterium]|nr:twin-arginine translocase subunit TatB [Alphaproteobacteria bacterium]HAJ45331.1 twin-arginine translocase subunit TatB [Alphaproteobacteria bacterium]
MFDIGWSEMALIAAVAIIVIGPKELPEALRTFGQWVGRARAYAREFQNHFDEIIREAEMKKMQEQWNRDILEKERLGLEAELMAAARPPEVLSQPAIPPAAAPAPDPQPVAESKP